MVRFRTPVLCSYLLSTQPKALRPPPPLARLHRGQGPSLCPCPGVRAWGFWPRSVRPLTRLSQSDGPTVGPSALADPHMTWCLDEMGLAHGAMAPTGLGGPRVRREPRLSVCPAR